MTKKESWTNAQVKRLLDSHKPGVHYYRPVPGVFGARHVDVIVCAYGYFAAIENKRPNKAPTDAQYLKLKEVEAAFGATFHIDGINGGLERLQAWLEWCRLNPVTAPMWPSIPSRTIRIIGG